MPGPAVLVTVVTSDTRVLGSWLVFQESKEVKMAKGRSFVPSKEKEGNWFQTRGWPRKFDDSKPQESPPTHPPDKFQEKAETTYRRFRFSSHDNRHAFQDHGEYFRNGLGRRILPDRSQHYSNNLITWNTTGETRSCYTASYRGQQSDEQCRYRRFPRDHPTGKPGSAPLSTSTTRWFKSPDVPFRTPLHVLAVSQEPFLPPNRWAYSYRPIWH